MLIVRVSMTARRWLPVVVLPLLVACVQAPPSRPPVYVEEEGPVVVRERPPVEREEIIPAAPGAAYVWHAGYWRWRNGGWVWEPGHYVERPHPSAVWVPGHWVERRYGWAWVPGHWM